MGSGFDFNMYKKAARADRVAIFKKFLAPVYIHKWYVLRDSKFSLIFSLKGQIFFEIRREYLTDKIVENLWEQDNSGQEETT